MREGRRGCFGCPFAAVWPTRSVADLSFLSVLVFPAPPPHTPALHGCDCQAGLNFESGVTSYTLAINVTGSLSVVVNAFITVTDVNEAPVPTSYTVSVSETAALNTVVLASIAGNDPDAGTVLTYSIQVREAARSGCNAMCPTPTPRVCLSCLRPALAS